MSDNVEDVAGQSNTTPSTDGRPSVPAPEPSLQTEEVTPVVVHDETDQFESNNSLPYPVVAIGASAGGIEAYIELFKSLPPDSGMAFVVLPHLLADHKSHLVEILSRNTTMPIAEIVT